MLYVGYLAKKLCYEIHRQAAGSCMCSSISGSHGSVFFFPKVLLRQFNSTLLKQLLLKKLFWSKVTDLRTCTWLCWERQAQLLYTSCYNDTICTISSACYLFYLHSSVALMLSQASTEVILIHHFYCES